MKKIILTNNPMMYIYYGKLMSVEYHKDASYLDVLQCAAEKILSNYRLLNHPLYSNLKSNETPYRTIILEASNKFDVYSYDLLEKGIKKISKQFEKSKLPIYKESIYEDFQLIDVDLISHMLEIQLEL